jgi:hypothetical protein
MWAMFALQLYWGGIMLQKAVLKFVFGKKDVTKLELGKRNAAHEPRAHDK